MEKVVERFLRYVQYDTRSDESFEGCPSTEKQKVFAEILGKELQEIGLQEVSVDEHGYVMATLPANVDHQVPVIGFIAHMDTSPDFSGENVKPRIVRNYDGRDIVLNEQQNILLSPADFPELKDYIGRDLITTDGTTLLGADNKAGIAEIITAAEYLIQHPEIPHGTIKIGFTPDEEIGRGADLFDVERFGALYAYTVDGGPIGELEYENFNAAGAKITINGRNVHPGSAKNKMINSMLIAVELASMLPQEETPAHTEGYEGFYHLNSLNGDVEQTKMHYIIREFDKKRFEDRKNLVKHVVDQLNQKYGEGTVALDLKDQYYNMREKIEAVKHVVDIAYEAMQAVDVEPAITPVRGGTDGARLSYMGLPTPNIFTGGHNFHGRYEYIPTYAMEKAVEVIVKIAELYGKKG
ncbi:tripeptide aminopeptidase [Geosporobacter subterraneus DSM 17957]|uniref:Peptidase T n=1 Tax=Geosporobacter subterraneus DSM 17957 TaxID=1121919 RepID=A0A1M6KSZ7_9FIRM|nr:peptidase T [Geosporobacter subterraneus]SHJ62012.1 tripeptide aminopeptidase [Geosporobacter subterraneus DSM 17957]